jgi:hypothetical protein
MNSKSYKRQYREVDDATKERISASLRGRSKSITHAQAISQGMKEYWQGVPSREANGSSNKTSNPQHNETM